MPSIMKQYKEKMWLENLKGQALSDIEIKYLELKGDGLKRNEIIEKLGLSAEYHERRIRKIILAKLEEETVTGAFTKAVKLNLLYKSLL